MRHRGRSARRGQTYPRRAARESLVAVPPAARASGWIVAVIGATASLATGAWLLARGLDAPAAPEPVPEPVPFTAPAGAPVPDIEEPSSPGLAADRLAIPSLGIEAPLVRAGVSGHSLDIPDDPGSLTLYDDGGDPCGTTGTVLLAGHVVSRGVRGALWPLHAIEPGARAWLTCGDGTLTAWTAVAVDVTAKRDLPQDLFASTGPHRLVVVTCGGPVMPDGHYRDNVIVYFEPADA